MSKTIKDVGELVDQTYAIIYNDTYWSDNGWSGYGATYFMPRIEIYPDKEQWLSDIQMFTQMGKNGWKAVKMNIPSIQLIIEVKE